MSYIHVMARMNENRDGKVIHPRLPHDLHEALTAYAKDTERTLTGAVVYGLRQFLKAEGYGPDADTATLHTR